MKLILAAAFFAASAIPALASDSTSRLRYLPGFDTDAIQMLSCADMMTNDRARFSFLGKNTVAQMAGEYRKAGRAAVVRAALEAPGAPAAPKVANISFQSKDATIRVTNDLRVHEQTAAAFVQNVRESGFDISSSCTDPEVRAKAEGLNGWFQSSTTVLTDVK